MIEVEIKIPVEDREQIAAGLLRCGFAKGDLIQEADVYFNNDAFDLRKQDMALRVRSCENRTTGVSESFLTFKGPKLDDRSMTRKELETAVGDAEVCMEIIRSLGYYPLKPVRKLRQHFHEMEMRLTSDKIFDGLQRRAEESCHAGMTCASQQEGQGLPECGKMAACLDQVEGLGDFLELEILLDDEKVQGNEEEECGQKEGCNSEKASEWDDKSKLKKDCEVEERSSLEEGCGTESMCRFGERGGRNLEEGCGTESMCRFGERGGRNLEEGCGTERKCTFGESSGVEEERKLQESYEKELRLKMAREEALRRMDEVLEALGLNRSRMTRTSYLSMLYGK